MSDLPSVCKDHPNAEILHEWDQTHYVLNGFIAGVGTKSDHRYFCQKCRRELCSPKEYEERERLEWG